MRSHFSYAYWFLAACVVLSGQAHSQDAEIEAIMALQDEQAAAWNRHDAAAYAKLFTEDADVVNVLGWWWKGRPEIERKLSRAFAFVFADSQLVIEAVHVRLLGPNYAVAHVIWQLEGAKSPPGAPAPPGNGIQLQVLRRDNAGWRIISFQNTNSIPEVEFPTTSPSASMPQP